ncbi:spore germination protein, partial [Effusibacillus lacus]
MKRRSFFKKIGELQNDSGLQTVGQAVDSSLEKNARWIRSACALCQDVKSQKLQFQTETGSRTALLLYCEGLADIKQIPQTIVPGLEELLSSDQPPDTWNVAPLSIETDLEIVIAKVFQGALAVFVDGIGKAYLLDISNPPQRTPEEPNTEVSIRGPRDGFVEELTVNVALVRKRLKTRSLACEKFVLGRRSQTRAALLYMEDIINPQVRDEIRNRLSNINFDAVYTSSQLEEHLADSSFSIFPLFHYTGRPDHVVTSLLLGRFAILLDGLPTALIGPANLFLLLKSPEDFHVNFLYVIMERLVRFLGAVIAVFLPGFYIAITTYHQDQIPLTLLATFITARKGVPFPTPVEAFIMLTLFEILREAGLRLPGVIGQTLAVVG